MTANPCPICGKPAVPACRPFCSTRCADVDLHSWLSDSYAVPAPPDDDEAERVPDAEEDDAGQAGRGSL